MKRVKYTTPAGGRKPGVVTDLPDEEADALVAAGDAEEYDDSDSPVRLRARRGFTAGGVTVSAGAVEVFEQSDEVWEAVNRGDADLDPQPGEKWGGGVQPFPPGWVSEDETTDAPLPRVAPQPVVAVEPREPSPRPRAKSARAAKAERAERAAARGEKGEKSGDEGDKGDAGEKADGGGATPQQPARQPQRTPNANPPTPGTVGKDPHTPPKK